MANFIEDCVLTPEDWVSIYALASIPVGTALVLQNKAGYPCIMWVGPTKPDISHTSGYVINRMEVARITEGESNCWVLGQGPICVQEAD